MPLPLVLIHGYSSNGEAFHNLRDQLTARNVKLTDINICTYISLNNEITIKDIAEGLDRAYRSHPILKDEKQPFDVIVHSTGMLVLRSWLTNYGMPAKRNNRLKRVKHIIGLAPATWGSPQAAKGRSWLGALVKGNKELGPDFMNAGDEVLDGLELGSRFTWDLAHMDLLDEEPYYGHGPDTPYVSIFIGNQPYTGLSSVANDPGTDGTVRWAGCALNTRKLKIDLTRTPVDDEGKPAARASMSDWADNRLDVPLIAVDGRNHSSLVTDPPSEMLDRMLTFLEVDSKESYDKWLRDAQQFSQKAMPRMLMNPGGGAAGLPGQAKTFFGHLFHQEEAQMEGWQQFVIHARDERGDGVNDYIVEILRQDATGEWKPFEEMYTDVHAYKTDPSYRCIHIRLPKGMRSGEIKLRARIHASTGTELMTYQGYGDEAKTLTATSEPVELDIPNGENSIFFPFTTTLIEIILNREPLPFGQESKILTFIRA